MFDLTIMLPCRNEAKSLPFVLARIAEVTADMDERVEVLVVDNGSTDATAQIAEAAGARVVYEAAPGYGSAVRRGLQEAQGSYIVYADSDASYDFAYVPAFLACLKDGADLVTGSRFHGYLHPDAMPWTHRYIGTPALTAILNFLYRTNYLECNCGLRALRKDTVAKLALRAPGMEMASEMLIRAKKCRLRVEQIPIDFFPDKRGGPSHLRTLRDGWRHLRLILVERFQR